jgi:hypothetical protein
MSLHNTRIDVSRAQTAERVDVFLCRKHGFFHTSASQPLRPGM